MGLSNPLHCLYWGGLANVSEADHFIDINYVKTMTVCDGFDFAKTGINVTAMVHVEQIKQPLKMHVEK